MPKAKTSQNAPVETLVSESVAEAVKIKPTKSAYRYFFDAERSAVIQEFEGIGNKDIMRRIGERWNALKEDQSEGGKQRLAEFEALSATDKARYLKEKELAPPVKKAEKAPKAKGRKPKAEIVVEEEEEDVVVVEAVPEPKKRTKKAAATTAAVVKIAPVKASKTVKATASGTTQPTKVNGYLNYSKRHRPDVKAELPALAATDVNKELGRRWKELTPEQQEEYKH